jgi:NAD(P)H-nitrite reductase large subunit
MQYDSVIIGSGFAGISAAQALVANRPGSTVLLINGEDRSPYKRTKISKNIAAGYDKEAFALFEPSWFEGNSIELVSSSVARIDKERHTLALTDGAEVAWKTLILATGASPKQAFGPETLVVRTARDGEGLIQALHTCNKAAVIGGGVLGVEVAEQLRLAGASVTLFCRNDVLMSRELNQHVSQWLGSLYAQKGVDCRLGISIDTVSKHAAGYTVQSGDESWRFDCVVECTGSRPNIQLAQQAGLATQTGILVNSRLQTSHPAILAAGDCAELEDGTVAHLWHQAEDQGLCAGRNAAAFLQKGAMETYSNRPRRLKCEVFGTYIFSLNAHLRSQLDMLATYRNDTVYQEFGFESGALRSVIMTGDKARAKDYERAVWERWSQERVEEVLAV